MHALTLHQPWAGLILHHGKTVENRSWAPPRRLGRIAVHAGRTVDRVALDHLSAGGEIDLPDYLVTQGLLGTVVVTGAHTATSCPGRDGCRQWGTSSGWHWLLSDPRPFPDPIPARGRQRLWALAPDQAHQLSSA